ncbi:acyltransferase family protein [Leptospira fletcheri]|uniref:acyltransferase family protein n=1 Tax=Leptospira fletcheri TaxID=2484981 RepID=UPI0014384CFA|nr:heparan-alpha-glucosaminide N-acetyltransferase domain-containing protein [Leptospira fletcheri]
MENSIRKRLLSLDALRGFTVAGMILVNNPGSWSAMYSPLRHTKWNGCTPTDLVFPFFLFSVGVSVSLSFAPEGRNVLKIWKRSLTLFGIGLFLHWFGEWDLSGLRIPGVLQRISFVYFFTALLYPLDRKFRVSILGILLFGYWILLSFITPPGSMVPNLEPNSNWGAWLDRSIFGEAHLWKSSRTWDPEGLLGSVSAVSTALLGTMFGDAVRFGERKKIPISQTAFYCGVAGLLLLVLGGLWDRIFPINKSLWTSSYVVWTAGWAALLFGFFLFLEARTETIRNAIFFPWLPFGRNAILVFFGSGILARSLNLITIPGGTGKPASLKHFLFQVGFAGWAPTQEFASFSYALANLLFWFAILYWLDRKKLYWKI